MRRLLSINDVVAITSLLTGERGEVFGSQTPDNIALLAEVAKYLPRDSTCVEIGTRVGYSTVATLLGNLDITLTTIDKNSGCSSIIDTFKDLEKLKFLQDLYHTEEWKLSERVNFLSGSSVIMGEDWSVPVDYLFLDGDHSYAGLMDDLAAWLPKLKVGSVLGFHDYGHPKNKNMDVTSVVNDKMFYGDSTEWKLYKGNYQMMFFQKVKT